MKYEQTLQRLNEDVEQIVAQRWEDERASYLYDYQELKDQYKHGDLVLAKERFKNMLFS